MYHIFVQLDDGKLLVVASRDEFTEAVQLIEGLNAYWPRDYVLRDSEGNNISFGGAALGADRSSALSIGEHSLGWRRPSVSSRSRSTARSHRNWSATVGASEKT